MGTMDREALRPTFIIGGSRTGSEMLKTMLSASTELDFVDELFLKCPRWLHKDLETNIKEHVGELDQPESREKLIELLYSGIPYGWFWSLPEENLNREFLSQELARRPLSLQSIFLAILLAHSRMRSKSGIGAKFPMHYSHTGLLLEWFPNCRLVHTTRNPKAVYASQASKYITREQNAAEKAYMRFRQFAHINIQTAWTARLHSQLMGLSNYRLVRYEDVVRDPKAELTKLCAFLEVDFVEEMLSPTQYGSSFDEIGERRGVDDSSLERWRSTISPTAAIAMDIVHARGYRLLGYSDS